MTDRESRIDDYHEGESARRLAELLVDAEDEIEMWKARIVELEGRRG